MVVIDTHLAARGASNGGLTFHDRGGPYGRTKGAKRVVAVDVTGLPVAALAVPAVEGVEAGCFGGDGVAHLLDSSPGWEPARRRRGGTRLPHRVQWSEPFEARRARSEDRPASQ